MKLFTKIATRLHARQIAAHLHRIEYRDQEYEYVLDLVKSKLN